MPTSYPPEFRRGVIAVARRGEQARTRIARSFGISESCLARRLAIADRDEGRPSTASSYPNKSTGLGADPWIARRLYRQLEHGLLPA